MALLKNLLTSITDATETLSVETNNFGYEEHKVDKITLTDFLTKLSNKITQDEFNELKDWACNNLAVQPMSERDWKEEHSILDRQYMALLKSFNELQTEYIKLVEKGKNNENN